MHSYYDAAVPPCVLYVEDNEINALLMQALFERRPDLRLLVAPDCASALRCAAQQPPSLLLLDLRLPDGHGSTLLPQLRALPGLDTVTAVAVTAEDLHDIDLRAFDAVWPKPLHLQQVLQALDDWLPLPRSRGHASRSAPALSLN